LSLTSVLFLAAYFSGCIAALVRHPVYGLITYVLMLYLHPPSRWWGQALPDLRWSLLAAAFTLLGVLMKRKSLPTAAMRKGRRAGCRQHFQQVRGRLPITISAEACG